MALKFQPGDTFPDAKLTDETGQQTTIAAVAGKSPLMLAFYRGPW